MAAMERTTVTNFLFQFLVNIFKLFKGAKFDYDQKKMLARIEISNFLFLTTLKTLEYGGEAIMVPLVTLVFLKVEEQNLEAWGILTCFLQNDINFQI